jgi:hypothetical protein
MGWKMIMFSQSLGSSRLMPENGKPTATEGLIRLHATTVTATKFNVTCESAELTFTRLEIPREY